MSSAKCRPSYLLSCKHHAHCIYFGVAAVLYKVHTWYLCQGHYILTKYLLDTLNHMCICHIQFHLWWITCRMITWCLKTSRISGYITLFLFITLKCFSSLAPLIIWCSITSMKTEYVWGTKHCWRIKFCRTDNVLWNKRVLSEAKFSKIHVCAVR